MILLLAVQKPVFLVLLQLPFALAAPNSALTPVPDHHQLEGTVLSSYHVHSRATADANGDDNGE